MSDPLAPQSGLLWRRMLAVRGDGKHLLMFVENEIKQCALLKSVKDKRWCFCSRLLFGIYCTFIFEDLHFLASAILFGQQTFPLIL